MVRPKKKHEKRSRLKDGTLKWWMGENGGKWLWNESWLNGKEQYVITTDNERWRENKTLKDSRRGGWGNLLKISVERLI